MTALARLRTQMLVALGLPGCWTQAASHEPAPPPAIEPVVIAPPPRRQEPIVSFVPTSCQPDTIVESICGLGEDLYCEATAAHTQLKYEQQLSLTRQSAAEDQRASFQYDEPATLERRAQLAGGLSVAADVICCYSRCTELTVGHGASQQPRTPQEMVVPECIPFPVAGTRQPAPNSTHCPVGIQVAGELRPYATETGDSCCYDRRAVRINPGGRPARVAGEPRFADVAPEPAWLGSLVVDTSALTATQRAQLAESWLASARMEHASIATFSSLALRLLALGAPPDLIAACHTAALDEIVHAQIAFALAAAYAGHPVGPGAFTAAHQLTTPMSLAELVRETFLDGCVGETVAALEAERAAEAAHDPALAVALRRIATDEARHAELAWAIVAWGLRCEPALGALLVPPSAALAVHESDDEVLAAHGHVGAAAHARAVADVLAEVVAPCCASLAA